MRAKYSVLRSGERGILIYIFKLIETICCICWFSVILKLPRAKISQIEIVNDVNLIIKGDKVTASQAALLQKLNIDPFSYGLVLRTVYDNGSVFDAKVLDVTEDILAAKFSAALSTVASLSLAIGYPTQASIPHSIANAFKMLIAVTIGCGSYTFDKAAPYKELLCAKKAEPAAEEAPAAEAAAPAKKADY